MKWLLPKRSCLLLLMFGIGGATIASAQATALSCSGAQDVATLEQRTMNLVRAEVFLVAECNARMLVQLSPESANGHYLLGYILNRENKPAASLAEYTSAAHLRKPTGDNLAVVALDYVLLNDNRDAQKWMQQTLLTEGRNALYWYYLGRIEYNLNAFSDARKAFEMAHSLEPNDPRPVYNLGLALEGLGDTAQAASRYRQAIAQEQKSTVKDAQPYLDLGLLQLVQNDPAGAVGTLQQALARDGRNPAIDEALGKAEEKTGQLTASRADLEQAIALAPNVPSLHFELGRVEQKLHETQAAKQQFARCAEQLGTHSSGEGINIDFSRAP